MNKQILDDIVQSSQSMKAFPYFEFLSGDWTLTGMVIYAQRLPKADKQIGF
jgi:hypothetical protein